MKLKLVKEYEYNGELLPIDSIIEVEDEVQAQGLIESGIATAYTEEVEVEEEVEAIKECAKSINTEVETKSLQVKETENMNMFGKSIKDAIATKAVTTYASTEATQPLGIVSLEAGLAGMARKQPITGNLNIVYSATETTTGNLPVLGIVGECTTADTDTNTTDQVAASEKETAAEISGSGTGTTAETETTSEPTNPAAQQIVEVTASSGGYSPKKIEAKAGVPTILVMKSDGAYGCERAFNIPDLNISEILPENGQTQFDLGTHAKGTTLTGVCGMGMYYFQIFFN